MSKHNTVEKDIVGPTAPKDPVARRSGFYIMLESVIEATARNEGKPTQDIYLEDRLADKAKFTGGVTDEAILSKLSNCADFHNVVHSIGVSVKSHRDVTDTVDFVIQNWGRTNKYESGTLLRVPCAADGSETIITLSEQDWSADDDVPGKYAFEFKDAGELATATVKLYLNDGYEVPELTLEPPVAYESEAYRSMIARSLLSKGNNKRLKAAIAKAQRGEEVTIAYIGGSITQGAGAKPIHTESYAYKSYVMFKEMFGKDGGSNVHLVKAGVGGTPSELGMIRYDRDVLKDGAVKPDIVFVEFAVNDEGDETKGVCYESLCLRIAESDNNPAVVLMFAVFVNDWNLQDRLSPVGRYYGFPMVSVKDAVVEQFQLTKAEGNIISKRQYFYDIYHPTNDGHTVMADCIGYLFSETAQSVEDQEDITLNKAPLIGNAFTGVKLLDRSRTAPAVIDAGGFQETDSDLHMVEMDEDPHGSPQFPYNWMHTAESGDSVFTLTITSRSLLLVFKDSGDVQFGKADIHVDGRLVLTADPHVINWTHATAVILYQEDVSREHRIEIKMSADDADKKFTILGFGYTE
ncbi:SGNH/GDSL hydrolase family protein [Paenibacillus kobensis]|uniref:SGNH/GDSL hydrolase family protein n=1 Tax=Paenibacillus kobensis TaxID=59841 RepID=UPI000FDB7EF0|nr:SGNH/GDSL hydrolase family protein [Paenibacillus kobensis]